ncbi:hypothetical protein QJS66_00255 [Kocuria rhizophila]|nr:hypothetical protein QJS66_00255 [Kocuria rhizophila]
MAAIAYVVWVSWQSRHGYGQFIVKSTMPKREDPLRDPHPPRVPLNLIIRPVTHALRVFATMFAGHMAMMVAAGSPRTWPPRWAAW